MEKRYWHGLNRSTYPIGFGCWQISGNYFTSGKPQGWGAIGEDVALDLLETAMRGGIDFFDTAQGYNNGTSERLLGKAIKKTGCDVVVCTKISLNEEEIKLNCLSDAFCGRVEKSLENLQLSCIDILLLHNPPDNIDWRIFNYQVLDELVKQGKIRTYGVSSRSLNGAKKAVANNLGTTIEWVFNIFERRPITELFSLIEDKHLNFIARSSLSRGLINPKYIASFPSFSDDDFRSTLPKDWVEWVIQALRLFTKNGVPENEIINQAILFCLEYEAVKSSIIGIKTKDQLQDILNLSNSDAKFLGAKSLKDIPDFYPPWG